MAQHQNPQKKPFGDIPPEITAGLQRVRDAAGRAATKIGELRDRVKTSMTPAEVSQVQGEMNTLADQLEAASAEPTPPPEPIS